MKSVEFFFIFFLGSKLTAAADSGISGEEFDAAFAKAACDFALDLIKTASKEPGENLVVSPSSIGVLLAVLQQGAGGNTADQIEKVLRLSSENSKIGYGRLVEYLRGEKTNLTLEWGNRAFVAPGFNIRDSFAKTVEDNFDAGFEELDFRSTTGAEAAAKINDWVKEATHDRIRDLVDASFLTSDVVLVMANAMYFKSFWDSPFQKYKTKVGTFHAGRDAEAEVPFMRQAGRFAAGEDADLGVAWVELPFKDDNFSMIFVLPVKEDGLEQATQKIRGADLVRMIGNESSRRVRLVIPKFKISKKFSLADALKELGLTDVFSDLADLKGISQAEDGLRLSQLIHQADVEIDEDGSTAAAATLEIVQTLSLDWFADELHFKADRPFLFFIADKVSRVPVFAGRVVNPAA